MRVCLTDSIVKIVSSGDTVLYWVASYSLISNPISISSRMSCLQNHAVSAYLVGALANHLLPLALYMGLSSIGRLRHLPTYYL